MSYFSLFTAGLALLAPFASAYTQPTGDAPEGNPILTPGLNDVIPVGTAYPITWTPTTDGTVTLVFLKGPSENAVPQYPIVEAIPNTGSYLWTPPTDLAPGDTGYGIQLIVDATGQYQYSTQFGISNPSYVPSSSTSTVASYSATSYSTTLSSASGYASPSGYMPHPHNSTVAFPTGYLPHNHTNPHPTGHIKTTYTHKPTHKTTFTEPSFTHPSPTKPVSSPTSTGGAAIVGTSFVGLVFAAGMAVFAL